MCLLQCSRILMVGSKALANMKCFVGYEGTFTNQVAPDLRACLLCVLAGVG
jgi:hypothetical protein